MRGALLLPLLLALGGCSGTLARIQITDVRLAYVSPADDRRLVVDVDVQATEGGGRSVGVVCVGVTFPGQTTAQRVCDFSGQLEDGDTKTYRITSNAVVGTGGQVAIRAELADTADQETRLAP